MRTEEEYHKLVEDNHNLIYGYLRMYNFDVEEYYDLAAIGLCKAAQTYNPGLGFTFATYAYKCIQREFGHQYDKKNRQKRKREPEFSLDRLKSNRDYCFASNQHQSDDIEQVQDQISVQEFMSLLNELESDIVSMRMQGFTLQEIGNKYHVSRQAIEQRMRKIKSKYKMFSALQKVG